MWFVDYSKDPKSVTTFYLQRFNPIKSQLKECELIKSSHQLGYLLLVIDKSLLQSLYHENKCLIQFMTKLKIINLEY